MSRAERKVKKRALEDAIPDLPGDNEAEVAEVQKAEKKSKKRKRDGEEDAEVTEESKKVKKDKKDKKKRRKTEEEDVIEEAKDEQKVEKKEKKSKKDKKEKREEEAPQPVEADTVMAEETEAPKKSKKERKAERKAKEAAEAATKGPAPTDGEAPPNTNGEATEESADKKSKKNNRNRKKKRKSTSANGDTTQSEEGKSSKAARFIVFIGNLPFTATTESITAHFASVKPKSVRHLTQKDNPTKSKGCAFVEFEGYDHMKTCLKLFHHSMFDDGLSAPRKINVELTAGGGGNTKDRRAKIQGKNEKLNEERFRRIQEEEKAKLAKAAEGGKTIDESAIHPSRRGRVPVA